MSWTTELDAVNAMLAAIGEAPVESLTSDLPEAQKAQRALATVSRETQSKGWNFNKETNFPLTPGVTGEIFIGTAILSLDPSNRNQDYVQRGPRLYDKKNHTYVFKSAVDCDLTLFLSFNELPETARRFITVRAARRFQKVELSSGTLDRLSADEEDEAWIALLHAESESTNANMFDDDPQMRRTLRRS